MRRAGLAAAGYDALLSAESHTPAHKDAALDRRRNARDCLVEVLVMARCRGLISTLSNVSCAAVFFAPTAAYRHFLFAHDAEPEPDEPEMW